MAEVSGISLINPELVHITRGRGVESRHRAAIAILSVDGRSAVLGNVDSRVYARSTIKLFQAIPLVHTGAAEAFGLEARELSVACGSHDSEPEHVNAVRSILAKANVRETELLCGTHWPLDDEQMRCVASEHRRPQPVENNCSGKHAALLAVCRHLGLSRDDYCNPEHPVQAMVQEVVGRSFNTQLTENDCEIDGCGVPTFGIELRKLAFGFAQLCDESSAAQDYRQARQHLMGACVAEPFYVGGSRRFCSHEIARHRGSLLIKVGAEGLYCAAFPRLGLGMALKCDDGANRAAKVIAGAIVRTLLDGEDKQNTESNVDKNVYDCNGNIVGFAVEADALVRFCEMARGLVNTVGAASSEE